MVSNIQINQIFCCIPIQVILGYNKLNSNLHSLPTQAIFDYNRQNAHYIAYLSKLAQSWT